MEVYLLIFALNVFNTFFTPTYKATIPQVTGQNDYLQAIALSSVTYQSLSVLGSGFAGAVAAFIGARQIFFLDAMSFVVAAILTFSIPEQLRVVSSQPVVRTTGRTWQDSTARRYSARTPCGLQFQCCTHTPVNPDLVAVLVAARH